MSEQLRDRKMLPPEERRAIANCLLWIRDDLRARGQASTQAGIGQALGGVSQPAIGKALKRAEVGPVIRDAVLKYTGLSREELVRRHGDKTNRESSERWSPVVEPVKLEDGVYVGRHKENRDFPYTQLLDEGCWVDWNGEPLDSNDCPNELLCRADGTVINLRAVA